MILQGASNERGHVREAARPSQAVASTTETRKPAIAPTTTTTTTNMPSSVRGRGYKSAAERAFEEVQKQSVQATKEPEPAMDEDDDKLVACVCGCDEVCLVLSLPLFLALSPPHGVDLKTY